MFKSKYHYRIETQEDWWAVLEAAWDDILITTQQLGYDLNVIATDDLTRDGRMVDGGRTCLEDLVAAKQSRDWQRVRQYLGAFWMAAPDNPFIRDYPAWSQLCDLCSEDWVFNPEEFQP